MVRKAKNILKSFIQRFFRIIQPDIKIASDYSYKILGEGNNHFYVGYYDINPLNQDLNKIICHKVSLAYTDVVEPNIGEIGLLCIDTNKFERLCETRALNWQLGSRAQWIDRRTIMFNDISNNLQVSKVFDIETKKVIANYDRSFWAISPDKKVAGSLNFSRIKSRRPGYGYKGISRDVDKEILTIFSLETRLDDYSVSLDEILDEISFEHEQSDPYLNHIAWSPCSRKLLTLFHYEETNLPRKIYPIIFDLDLQTWQLIDGSGLFSHHVWLDKSHILAYMQHQDEMGYFKWSEISGWKLIENSMPDSDGHPSLINGTESIVVDSYPDVFGRMNLFLGSINPKHGLTNIGRILNLPQFSGALRCDLHPRTSKEDIITDIPTKNGRRILFLKKT